jgi:localization factor PodJL
MVLLLAFAAPAAADYYNAVTAFDRGEFATARAELEPLIAAGDPRAQLLLGRMYADGNGVVQDYVRAHQLLNLAAAAGLEGASAARDELATRMTAAQIADAQRLAAAAAVAPGSDRSTAAVPEETAVAAPAPEPQPLDRQGLLDLQWQLAVHGYDPGPADGSIGPRTTAAIRHYQADAGLTVDGSPTRALLDHLQFTVPAVRNATAPAPSVRPPSSVRAAGPRPRHSRNEVRQAG